MKKLFFTAALFALTSLNTWAVPLFEENFAYPTEQRLSTQAGGTGFGSNAWVVSGTYDNLTAISGTGLTYNLPGGGSISTAKSLLINGTGDAGAVTFASRQFSSGITSSDVYIRFLIQPMAGTQMNAGDVFGISIGGNTGNPDSQLISLQKGSGTDTSKYTLQLRTEGSSFAVSNDLSIGEPIMIVLRLSKGASTSYDNASLWINPGATLSTPDLDITSASGIKVSTLTQIGFRNSNLETTDQFLVGGIVAGTEWSDVVAIPEPSTTLILSLGAAAVIFCGLRKKGIHERK